MQICFPHAQHGSSLEDFIHKACGKRNCDYLSISIYHLSAECTTLSGDPVFLSSSNLRFWEFSQQMDVLPFALPNPDFACEAATLQSFPFKITRGAHPSTNSLIGVLHCNTGAANLLFDVFFHYCITEQGMAQTLCIWLIFLLAISYTCIESECGGWER